MGLNVPDLDDRTYAQLLEDVRKQIPVADADWTDHNAHDPGITVLELLTWLSESYRYQLDRIEDRHRRKYAQLLGFTPDPPRPATGTVSVDPDAQVAGETVPAGTRLVAAEGNSERQFETTRATPLTGASVAKVLTDTPAGRTDHSPAAAATDTFFHAFGETAAAGSTLYLGFDDDPLTDPTTPLSLHVAYHDAGLPEPEPERDDPATFEPTVDLTWEYCTDYRAWEWDSVWEPFTVVEDTTDRFYESGFVTLAHPGRDLWRGVDRQSGGILDTEGDYAWIRVRLTEPGYEVPPRFDRVRTNVCPVEHRASAGPETLTRVDGGHVTSARPHQRFEFEHAPVLSADITVGGDDDWEPVEDFDASGPDETVYVLDHETGTVEFGDNVRGAVPEAGQAVEAPSCEYGGGPAGNVQATADWRFASVDEVPSDRVAPPAVRGASVDSLGPTTGGRTAEDVDDTLDRLRRDLERAYRAVTAADFETVALSTPGLRFGRAEAVVTGSDEPSDCVDHDAIEVVVVPYSPETVTRPTPSDGFLEAVRCHLERNRLLTDRVTATAPTYVGIGVTVEVELLDGSVVDRRREAVTKALDEFLSPLRGFEGGGWPFGRPVYHSELYERVGAVEGVDCVTDVSVRAEGPATVTDDAVEIPSTALVAPLAHTVIVDTTGRECGEVR